MTTTRTIHRPAPILLSAFLLAALAAGPARADQLLAGVAKVDITNVEAGPVNDPLYVKALVLKNDETTVAIITLDAVAVGEIGHITNDYLPTVRGRLALLGVPPLNTVINASHCHGVVCADVAERTVQAVEAAMAGMVPVRVGAGVGHEDRISENRRMKLRDGSEADVRHAYSLPPDEDVAEVGPIDPEIGLLRFDALDGRTVAAVYTFACHPIMGVPSGGNTADIAGFASKAIEENLSRGAIALFLQTCGGDINPVRYKDVDQPHDAEPLGNLLGLSALRGLREIETADDSRLTLHSESLALPRADLGPRIIELEAERERLLGTLTGTSLNLKTFLPLVVKYSIDEDFPSYYSHYYLREDAMGRDDLRRMDATNRRNIEAYVNNIHTMEQLTRLQTNLALLRKHQQDYVEAGSRTIDVELAALRIGECVLLTFPGELTVRIGLNIKAASPHPRTVVAGYTNGYIYYAPTTEQLLNVGRAQEDSDCILGPGWQELFEAKALEMLGGL